MTSFLIATGADAGYFNLLRDRMASIEDQAPARPVALGVTNGGLTPTQTRSLSACGAKVVTAPGCPHDATYVAPGRVDPARAERSSNTIHTAGLAWCISRHRWRCAEHACTTVRYWGLTGEATRSVCAMKSSSA
jgi:hypothetical protein